MRYNIIDHKRLEHAMQVLSGLPTDGQWQIELKPLKQDLTGAQRRTAHMWLQLIANELGEDYKDVKDRVKDRLPFAYEPDEKRMMRVISWLVTMMERAYRKNPDKFDAFDFIESLRDKLVKLPIRERSSETYTKKEYADFITEIEMEAGQAGVILPHPDDYHQLKGN